MRKQDSIKNFFWGITGYVITTVLGIVVPRLVLLSYGSEVNGILTTVKQIFTYVALLEAGVGGASLQALYKPVAQNDHEAISEVVSATHYFFRKTGIIYLGAVVILAAVFPFTVQSETEKYIIAGIILLQGTNGVIKYFFNGKLNLLLKVEGKTYIITNFGTIAAVISNISRIALMLAGCNVLLVQSVFCFLDIIQVIYIIAYTKKHYPWLNYHAAPNFKAIEQRNSVLIHQISGLVFNNTDTILLTYVVGFKTVSVYAMYAMLCAMVDNIIGIVSSSVSFALGQLFHSSRERFIVIQEAYEACYLALVFFCYTMVLVFITPFLKLYTAGVTDITYIDKYLPILFVLTHLLSYGRNTSSQIIDFAGHYKQTQLRSIIETVINLTVSIICVFQFGIYGVLFGTIVALLYRANDIILYANHKIMKRSAIPTYRRWFTNCVLLIICYYVSHVLRGEINSYFSLFSYAIPFGLGVVLLYGSVTFFTEPYVRRIVFEQLRK